MPRNRFPQEARNQNAATSSCESLTSASPIAGDTVQALLPRVIDAASKQQPTLSRSRHPPCEHGLTKGRVANIRLGTCLVAVALHPETTPSRMPSSSAGGIVIPFADLLIGKTLSLGYLVFTTNPRHFGPQSWAACISTLKGWESWGYDPMVVTDRPSRLMTCHRLGRAARSPEH